ncbi:MAG: bifunctional diaminohydroxyphosphoribosylaminopyrimidine deaminase/5-amino-6-(5-phosphoribosylamino)uracil reductase RibD, partial [Endomicrobium sp.]|nr:bifunctional diaminohydroxyphosphoribosylaminopyrimidine deaminase/5-amino-6-(5-phosphoribosylamino)uracil reductase RibD [Endomicrobium sp.]
MTDKQYMKAAVELAKKGKDRVFPNPMVGCVIVKDNKIIGKGWHKFFGGNHAEVNAVLDAGTKAKGADLYVTLEPCNSYGKKPPCTKTIIEAGIKRVFFAVKDPNVSHSRKTMEERGIEVCGGLLKKEAEVLVKD